MSKTFPILLCAFGLTLPLAARAAPKYHLARQIAVPGELGYHDYLSLDDGGRRLYVSHENAVVVLDPGSGQVVTTLTGFKKVHGIVLAAGRAFVTDGGADRVRAFEVPEGAGSWKSLGEATAGKNPDAITYDPASRHVFAFNHSGGSATVIDPATARTVATIDLGGGKVEAGQADGKGTVWVNVEDKNLIVRIDSRKNAVTGRWSIAPCQTPTGLGFDARHRRLFAGCEENGKMVVVDADSGKVITSVPIGDGVDGTEYDPATGNIFNACADGTLTVVHQDGPDRYSILQTVETMKGARTLAVDHAKNRVFLPARTPGKTLVVLVVEP